MISHARLERFCGGTARYPRRHNLGSVEPRCIAKKLSTDSCTFDFVSLSELKYPISQFWPTSLINAAHSSFLSMLSAYVSTYFKMLLSWLETYDLSLVGHSMDMNISTFTLSWDSNIRINLLISSHRRQNWMLRFSQPANYLYYIVLLPHTSLSQV